MAELLLKVNDGSGFEDGDCLCAFSDRHIARVHAERICDPKRAARNSSRLISRKSLAWVWMRETMRYRFERISPSRVRRVDQVTGQKETFGPSKIDVRQFLRRRQQKRDHRIFGEDGSEVWFGGQSDLSLAKITRIWTAIEKRSNRRRSASRFTLWPMGRLDIRSHLAIRTDAITEKQVRDFTEPNYETDDNGDFVWRLRVEDRIIDTLSTNDIDTPPDDRSGWEIMVAQKRRRKIPWRDIIGDLSETVERVTDPNAPVGHEIDEQDGRRYTSKTQRAQRASRIRKKPARKRKR